MTQHDELARRLSARISGADVRLLAHRAADDETLRGCLFDLAWSDDRRTADNATWVMTHLPHSADTWLGSRRTALEDAAMTARHETRRRLMLTLVERLPMTKDDVRGSFVDFCFKGLAEGNQPPGIRSLCLKLSVAHCRHFPELTPELEMMLDLMADREMKPGIRSAWKKARAFVQSQRTAGKHRKESK